MRNNDITKVCMNDLGIIQLKIKKNNNLGDIWKRFLHNSVII